MPHLNNFPLFIISNVPSSRLFGLLLQIDYANMFYSSAYGTEQIQTLFNQMQSAFMCCCFRMWALGEGNPLNCIMNWDYENTQVVLEKWLISKYSLELAGKHILQMLVS